MKLLPEGIESIQRRSSVDELYKSQVAVESPTFKGLSSLSVIATEFHVDFISMKVSRFVVLGIFLGILLRFLLLFDLDYNIYSARHVGMYLSVQWTSVFLT